MMKETMSLLIFDVLPARVLACGNHSVCAGEPDCEFGTEEDVMEWLAANWIWVLIGVLFISTHLFGHGGHGKHEGHEGHGRDGGHGGSGGSSCGRGPHGAKVKADADAAGTEKPSGHRH